MNFFYGNVLFRSKCQYDVTLDEPNNCSHAMIHGSWKGVFLVADNRVSNGPLGRSLCSFACTPHSAHLLCSASLANSVHRLAHSLSSPPRGMVENLEYVFTLLSRSTGGNAFLVVTRNTPKVILWPRLFYAPCCLSIPHHPTHWNYKEEVKDMHSCTDKITEKQYSVLD